MTGSELGGFIGSGTTSTTMTKKYKNGIPNGYKSDQVGRIYFAKTKINGIPLIKIGFWNGRYNIRTTLKNRYKTEFKILKSIIGCGDTEQDLHIKFSQYRHLIIYKKRRGCELVPVRCTEFFRENDELLEFIQFLP